MPYKGPQSFSNSSKKNAKRSVNLNESKGWEKHLFLKIEELSRKVMILVF